MSAAWGGGGALRHPREGYRRSGGIPSRPMRRLHPAVTLVAAALALGGCTGQTSSSSGDFEGAEADVAKVVDDLS